jgi:hypothetical protein
MWPDGVKIDVEGAEGLVLRGMTHLIERRRPWVMLELHGEFLGEDAVGAVWDLIWSRASEAIYIGGGRTGYRLVAVFEQESRPPRAHLVLLILF